MQVPGALHFCPQHAAQGVGIYGAQRSGAGDAGGVDIAETAKRTIQHFELAKKLKPDVLLLAHGAALSEPADAQYMLDHTGCHGVQLGSSVERMAMEKPLEERATSFKKVRFPK